MKFFLLPAFLVIAVSLFSSADGQVSAVTLTIASADRVPFATSKPITLAFTLATALSSGGRITVNYPTGFFASCVQPVVTGHAVIASSTETGVSSLVLTVNGTLAAAATTVTLVGLTMGGPTAGNAAGITVSTSSDTVSGGVASGTIGGQVTAVTMTIAAADRAAGATGKSVTLAFTTAVALASGDKVTMNYPSGFFVAAVTPTLTAATTGNTVGATGATSVIITAGGAINAGAITVTLGGLTLGGAVSTANSITVSTNKDLVSAAVATGAIGQVTGVTFTIADSARLASTGSTDVTIAFTLGVALAATDKVTINYPSGFISGTASSISDTVTSAASADFQVDGAAGADKLTIAVKTSRTPSGSFTLVLVGMTTGSATAGSLTGISVSAPGNAVSVGQDSGVIGSVYAFSITTPPTTSTVGTTTQSIIFTFKPAVQLASTALLTIHYPTGYFASGVAPSVTGGTGVASGGSVDTGVFAADTSAANTGTTSYAFKMGASKSAAIGTAVIITVSGLTMSATPQLASAAGFKLEATGNSVTRGVALPAVGVAVNSLGTMTIADRTAGATNKAVTLAFTPTVALASGDKVTISYPSGFFAAAVTPTAAPATLTAGATGSSSVILTSSASFSANAAITVTLSGLTMGGGASSSSVADSANGIKVTTDKNPVDPTGTATGVLGRVTAVSFAIAAGDRTPAAASKAVTIGFTLGVAITGTAPDKVTINYPSGFITGTPSSITSGGNAVSDDFEASGAAGATSITIAVKTGRTVAAAAVTVTLNGMTLGAATAGVVASVTVSAPGNAVSTVGADSGAIGGAVSAVSFYSPNVLRAGATNQTVTVTFTTASSTPLTTGRITINYPSGYFATSPTPVIYSPSTIASAAAPTATAIVLSVGGAAIGAGTVTVVLGGLTIGSTAVACGASGITVNTNVDYSASSALAPATGAAGGDSGATAGPNANKSPASFLYISASFVLAFVFAVLA